MTMKNRTQPGKLHAGLGLETESPEDKDLPVEPNDPDAEEPY
jgi:hypothetical protein